MPGTGTATPIGQTTVPINSSVALDEIPQRKLYIQNNGAPLGTVNSDALNSGAVFDQGSASSGAGNQMDNLVGAISEIAGAVQQNSATAAVQSAQTQALIANPITGTNQRIANTLDAVVGVQTSMDAYQAANSALFGFQTVTNAVLTTWEFSGSENYYSTAIDQLNNAAFGGAIILSQALLRLQSSVNFLVWYVYAEQSQGFYDVEDLNAATVQGLIAAKTDPLTYLQTVLPGYPWQDDQDGTGLVGMSWVSATDGIPRSYYWSPPAASLYDFYHLWDYTPTSGPPTRNGIDDFMQFLALVPVQWSSL